MLFTPQNDVTACELVVVVAIRNKLSVNVMMLGTSIEQNSRGRRTPESIYKVGRLAGESPFSRFFRVVLPTRRAS